MHQSHILQVVCSQVYCGPPVKALRYAHFGPGSGPIWMDNVDCTGEEAYLQECQFGGWRDHNCYHEEDASVICQTGKYRSRGPVKIN